MMKGDVFFREIEANCWDADLRIAEYAEFNTQVQVICTIPVMFSYWAKPKDTLELSRFLNDDIAKLVAEHPQNYVALATISHAGYKARYQRITALQRKTGTFRVYKLAQTLTILI